MESKSRDSDVPLSLTTKALRTLSCLYGSMVCLLTLFGLKRMISPLLWHDIRKQEQARGESASNKDLEQHEFRKQEAYVSYNLYLGSLYVHESSQISRLVYPDGVNRRIAQADTKSQRQRLTDSSSCSKYLGTMAQSPATHL